jgi:hypothetical protein
MYYVILRSVGCGGWRVVEELGGEAKKKRWVVEWVFGASENR